MPVGLKMPSVDSPIEVTSLDKITTATKGVMLAGNIIRIDNIFLGQQNIPSGPVNINILINS